jgi:glyoxylase-like metal-dependent hydrolase (beta-lactamase superfamily II)
MHVHHLDCCTMCPLGGAALWGQPARLVGHVLAIETPRDGIVLVDTGVGLADRADPVGRLGQVARFSGLSSAESGAAIRQLERLGFAASDVRHIVTTHFDFDHAGGIGDFPDATVHLLEDEQRAALAPPTAFERRRYRAAHVQAVQRWQTYPGTGEPWRGFGAAQRLHGLVDDILIVPLVGHTRGHAAVAVPRGDGFLLHCGDAYFRRDAVLGRPAPLGPRLFERLAAWDWARVRQNHARIAGAMADPSLTVICAHDPTELARAVEGAS